MKNWKEILVPLTCSAALIYFVIQIALAAQPFLITQRQIVQDQQTLGQAFNQINSRVLALEAKTKK